jgi:hypothetical protein
VASGAHPDAVTMMYEQFPVLEPKDISDAVIYSLGTPGRVQVVFFLNNFICEQIRHSLNLLIFRSMKLQYILLARARQLPKQAHQAPT